MSAITKLPDGSASFAGFVGSPDPSSDEHRNPVRWNPGNKVVQDHRDGRIIQPDTDIERAKRGLRVPWKPEYGYEETRLPRVP